MIQFFVQKCKENFQKFVIISLLGGGIKVRNGNFPSFFIFSTLMLSLLSRVIIITNAPQTDPTAINKLKAALSNSLATAQETGETHQE